MLLQYSSPASLPVDIKHRDIEVGENHLTAKWIFWHQNRQTSLSRLSLLKKKKNVSELINTKVEITCLV